MENVKQEMQATQQRFITFVGKLEEKAKEFAESAIPELQELNDTDDDEYKQAYHRMRAAVNGQLESLRKKAREVYDEKIQEFEYPDDLHELRSAFYEMRTNTYEHLKKLETLLHDYRERIETTLTEDFEGQYQRILEEFDKIKDQFKCTQCGGQLTIDKIYFTTTYITCPFCHTQNTFEPSSQAKSLEQLGRSLAEQRTKHLLEACHILATQESEAFSLKHRKELDVTFESNANKKAQLGKELAVLQQQFKEAQSNKDAQYHNYLRAMFDEWNSINPALTEEHERFRERMWEDHMKSQRYE